MGLFDTIHFKEPLQVPGWKQPVTGMQTKHFGSFMQDYTVGSLLPESPVLIGVVEDALWCAPEEKGGEGRTHPVYFAIWHRILAGVYLDAGQAEERLRTVDRLDLITWLDQAQRQTRVWKNRYHRLYADVREWHERQTEAEPPDERAAAFRRLRHRLPEEILHAPDPLKAILEKHAKQEETAGDGEIEWF
ncbi:MAG: hypothetical protein JJT96_11430 [Opitutales bacterium]|nr:hypothetical protein [Opitutales bacterium]